ncbi:MAG: BTAD domain-containing putative transcriptional regulator [Gemmatimonadales bacterium]
MTAVLRLLGGASLEREGAAVGGRAGQRQRLAFLALLALKPAGISRDKLIALLWPETDSERARHLLSHSLYVLRQALGDEALLVTGDTLRLNPAVISCDAVQFEDAVRAGAHARAAELYSGPLLDGFFLAESVEFERWVDAERERLAREHAAVLDALAQGREAAGDFASGAGWWRKLYAADPHNTRVAVRLARALAASGDAAGALHLAHSHVARLHDELELEPPAELAAEIERLQRLAPHATTPLPAPASAYTPAPPAAATAPRRRPMRGVAVVAAGLAVVAVATWSAVSWSRAARGAKTVSTVPVVAVLPFQELPKADSGAYFADALTDMISTELAEIHGLGVISRTSVDQYAAGGVQRRLPDIARSLGAGYVVEGSVVRTGRKARIIVQLIDATSDRHVWAQSYERDVADILALQAELARGVAQQIGVVLGTMDTAPARLASVPAYEAYLKGIYYGRTVGLERGVEWLDQAIALDSTLAPAYAELARNLYFQTFFGELPPRDGFARIRAAAARALVLDSGLADAHGTLALVLMHQDQDWRGAEREFQRALELDPNNAQVRHDYSHLLLARRRLRDADTESERAVALDPADAGLEACLGWHRIASHSYDSAVAQSLRAVRAAPDFFWAHQTLGWGYEEAGRYPEAVASLRKAMELSGQMPFVEASLGHALAVAGDSGAAAQLLERLTTEQRRRYISPYDLAVVNAGLGNKDRALTLLEQAYADRSAQVIHVGWDPRFDGLRGDARFGRLLRAMGLEDWARR